MTYPCACGCGRLVVSLAGRSRRFRPSCRLHLRYRRREAEGITRAVDAQLALARFTRIRRAA